jgi:hypothetical protein
MPVIPFMMMSGNKGRTACNRSSKIKAEIKGKCPCDYFLMGYDSIP